MVLNIIRTRMTTYIRTYVIPPLLIVQLELISRDGIVTVEYKGDLLQGEVGVQPFVIKYVHSDNNNSQRHFSKPHPNIPSWTLCF